MEVSGAKPPLMGRAQVPFVQTFLNVRQKAQIHVGFISGETFSTG